MGVTLLGKKGFLGQTSGKRRKMSREGEGISRDKQVPLRNVTEKVMGGKDYAHVHICGGRKADKKERFRMKIIQKQ